MAKTAETLDTAFRIGEQVRVADRDGATVVVVKTDACLTEIALQGAQVLSWVPAGQQDVLWRSPISPLGTGKAVRGGIPVCWPWFGPHPTDPSRPQHGLARTEPWRLHATYVSAAGAVVEFSLDGVGEAAGCELKLAITCGERLGLELTTHNPGAQAVTISEALHTYFQVGDVSAVTVEGLEGQRFHDNADGGREKVQIGACKFDSEVVALFDVAPAAAAIVDPILKRRIRIAREGGLSTVVWNPGDAASTIKDIPPGGAKQFVCVESGNIGTASVTIEPGTSHRLAATYAVEPL